MAKVRRKNSITTRWAVNNLGVVIVILLIIDIIAAVLIRYYYYNSAQQYVMNQMSIITSAIERYASDGTTNYNSEIRGIIENYEHKSQIELMAIDHNDQIAITSRDFQCKVSRICQTSIWQGLRRAARRW